MRFPLSFAVALLLPRLLVRLTTAQPHEHSRLKPRWTPTLDETIEIIPTTGPEAVECCDSTGVATDMPADISLSSSGTAAQTATATVVESSTGMSAVFAVSSVDSLSLSSSKSISTLDSDKSISSSASSFVSGLNSWTIAPVFATLWSSIAGAVPIPSASPATVLLPPKSTVNSITSTVSSSLSSSSSSSTKASTSKPLPALTVSTVAGFSSSTEVSTSDTISSLTASATPTSESSFIPSSTAPMPGTMPTSVASSVSNAEPSIVFSKTSSIPGASPSSVAKELPTAPISSKNTSTPTFSSTSSSNTRSASAASSSQTTTPSSAPHYRGFNVVNQAPADPNRAKTQAEWDTAFSHIVAFPGDFNAVRLYSMNDGSAYHLLTALPVAREHNLSVLAGVWSGGDNHKDRFATEKSALDDALTQLGCDNIVAVSVGNEDMYSNHRTDAGRTPLTDIMLLVNQTQEIMDVLDNHGCCDVKITHTDTFGDWLQTNISEPLVRQVDFLTANIFPYWSGQNIDVANDTFWEQVRMTKEMAARYGKEVWIGETGWPIKGAQVGGAIPSVDNLKKYWHAAGCSLMATMNAFWYVEWDDNAATSFGLMDSNGNSTVGDVICS